MNVVYKFSLLAILLVLPRPSLSGAITITNDLDFEVAFVTIVKGSVGFSATHQLVDIPDTPWVNSSVIVETNGSFGQADSLSVSWTSQHIAGPHAQDINPNPNEPVTVSHSFTPTAAGVFFQRILIDPTDPLQKFQEIIHPTNNGPHFDRFVLVFSEITVAETTLGGFDIQAYEIQYIAQHCTFTFAPPFGGNCNPPPADLLFPRPDEPLLFVSFGLDCEPQDEVCTSNVPEPGTLALLLAGCASLGAAGWKRRRGQ